MPVVETFLQYLPAIMELPIGRPYTKEELLTDKFLLYKADKISVYYAPHNAYINCDARVVIIGITPGWAEMELAFRTARMALAQGLDVVEIGKRVKTASQFTGATRINLVTMLDSLGLQTKLRISSCDELFKDEEDLLYSTAMLGYPVLVSGNNYNGHSPPLHKVPFLRKWALNSLRHELSQMDFPLLIPLGKAVEEVVRTLAVEGFVHSGQCLWGFPHPSGANGHRGKHFAKAFNQLKETVSGFPGNL
jgi:hypothetical protein